MISMQHPEVATAQPKSAFAWADGGPHDDRWDVDPMGEDSPSDPVVVTTSRRLLRLVIAATDVGGRFARDDVAHDPAAWMLAPRAMFEGERPIDACQVLRSFNRNVLVQGLGLGLDADEQELDDLLADTSDESAPEGPDRPERRLRSPLLLTAVVDARDGRGRVFGFCALVADRPADIVERVVGRFGAKAAEDARYRDGFDAGEPIVAAMVSDTLADTLALVASDPTSPLAGGLDVMLEQRFDA